MTVEEIYQQMAAAFEEETGVTLRGDGDMAVRLYAVAAQIYGLYVQAEWVDRQCFPQTAVGEFLDKHAQLRGLTRRAATASFWSRATPSTHWIDRFLFILFLFPRQNGPRRPVFRAAGAVPRWG